MRTLGHGYRLEARIVVWEPSDVLSFPGSALSRCAQSWCTFVVELAAARSWRDTAVRRAWRSSRGLLPASR